MARGEGNLGPVLTLRLGSHSIPLCRDCWEESVYASDGLKRWEERMLEILERHGRKRP